MATRSRRFFACLGLISLLAVDPACGRGQRGSGRAQATANEQLPEQPALAVGETDGAVQTPPATPTVVPDDPLPALRTGVVEPQTYAAMPSKLVAYTQDPANGYEYLEYHLERQSQHSGVHWQGVTFDPPTTTMLAGSRRGLFVDAQKLIIRRPLAGAKPRIRGQLLGGHWVKGVPRKVVVPFDLDTSAIAAGTATRDPGVRARFAELLATELEEWEHPWAKFAAGRLPAAIAGVRLQPRKVGLTNDRPQRTDLTRLMDTTSGVLSMQEALQHDRGLRVLGVQQTPTIDVSTLTGPTLDAHPFDAMRAQLPGAPTLDFAAVEPLAKAAPAEFWYARFADIRLMLRLLDEADTWITPIVQVLQKNPEDRKLAERYQTQLGLRRTGLARALGHTVVESVAVVGSDPYLREGSDVTLIFALRNQTLFDQELAGHLQAYRQQFPDMTTTTVDHEGVAITVSRDPSGRLRQHRAQVGNLALVGNSMGAMRKILDTLGGRSPALASEPDLHYMLARDPGSHQAFAFLSDKFIANVVGPTQKIQAARRQIALAELLSPGYAALLYGWLYGHQPATTEELIAQGVLAAEELKHGDGTPIVFTPGSAARSLWGSPDALTPLIDLPPLKLVTGPEEAAYRRFVRTYQTYWKRFIDPVAIRLDIQSEGGRELANIDVRILPLISASDYNQIASEVGDARVKVPNIDSGLMTVYAIADDAPGRKDLNSLMRKATGNRDLGVDWLGGWVAFGVEDRTSLLMLLSWLDTTVQKKADRDSNLFDDAELWNRLGKFPGYFAAEVKNPAPLVATLAGLKAMANDVAPGVIEWEQFDTHGDIPIVRVRMNPKMPLLLKREQAEAVAIYYALFGTGFAISPNLGTLKRVVDRLKKNPPVTVEEGAGQFVMQAHSEVGRPMSTAFLWMLQGQANETQQAGREAAEIIMRATGQTSSSSPDFARLARSYLGSVPLTAHGDHDFVYTTTGTGDPEQGTKLRPEFGELPYPNSPIGVLIKRLTGFRGQVAFDPEPAAAGADAQSLHSQIQVQLGPANG